MPKLSPRSELLLSATLFIARPAEHAPRLLQAAEDYLTSPTTDVSRKYTLQLGYAAKAVAERAPRDWPLAIPALREILDQAWREGKLGDADPALDAEIAGMKQWQERADLK